VRFLVLPAALLALPGPVAAAIKPESSPRGERKSRCRARTDLRLL